MSQALYGRALANIIPRSTTGYQARGIFGKLTTSLNNAYRTLDAYNSTGSIAIVMPALAALKFVITKEAVSAAKAYLDSTNTMLQKYYQQMPESHSILTDLQYQQLQTSVSGTSAAVHEIDDMFSTPWGAELAYDLATAAGTVTAWLATTTAKVAGNALGEFFGKAWWVVLLGAGGVGTYFLIKKHLVTRVKRTFT
jgi:hypothetical protein